MSLEESVYSLLRFPSPGASFNMLLKLLPERVHRQKLTNALHRLLREGKVTITYLPHPNGEVDRLYTDTQYLDLQYVLTPKDLQRALYSRFLRAEKRLKKKGEAG